MVRFRCGSSTASLSAVHGVVTAAVAGTATGLRRRLAVHESVAA